MEEKPWKTDPAIPTEILDRFYWISGLYHHNAWTRLVAEANEARPLFEAHPALLAKVLRFQADALAALEDLAGAIRLLVEARALAPDLASIREGLRGMERATLEETNLLGDREDWKTVQDLCKAALEAYPGNPRFEWRLGVSFDMQGRPGEAEPIFRRLVSQAPMHVENWRSHAISLAHLGRRADAIARCREAIDFLEPRRTLDLSPLTSLLESLESREEPTGDGVEPQGRDQVVN